MISLVTRANVRGRRSRGSIDQLTSGAYRVRVYGGADPVTGRRHDLTEIVAPGPRAAREAEKVRTRLLAQVDERRHPRTNASVKQLLERHLAEADIEESTRDAYSRYAKNHILPYLGNLKVGALDADVLESFYAELRRCRDHCSGGKRVDHRTLQPHDCDERCRRHECRPLASSTIRQIHFILSGAFKRAVRWRWVSENPAGRTEPPAQPTPNPKPPTPEEAARIINEAWKDPDWGTLVWLTTVTGMRRGELCALRWHDVDLSSGVLHVARGIGQRGRRMWEKDVKTHQERRVTLDPNTVDILREHRARCEARASALSIEIDGDAYVFSLVPDGKNHLQPDSITQRYGTLARRLGINTTIHKLRHYSATELITAGVDIRTVAGRLGHGSGGVTTLRVYAAWVSESDQRAAGSLAARMPDRPVSTMTGGPPADFEAKAPYEKVAASLRAQIMDGSLAAGLPLPPTKQIARDHGVSTGTAHRAMTLLADWGLVTVSAGHRARVRSAKAHDDPATARTEEPVETGPRITPSEPIPLDLEVRRSDQAVSMLRTVADPEDATALQKLLVTAIKRSGNEASEISDYELIVRPAGASEVLVTFVSI